MIVNTANIATMDRGFQTVFQRGYDNAASQWPQVATLVPSSTLEEKYGWLGHVPGMREWIGERYINNLSLHEYAIRNKDWELTVAVERNRIEDDQYGIYSPLIENMGYEARVLPDRLIFGLLKAGFNTPCYDGKPFFSMEHPILDASGKTIGVANMQSGNADPWFLLDTRRPLKPLIYQERKKPQFTALNRDTDEGVFMRGEFLYGVEARANVGFGFWQMALGSKAVLDEEHFEAALASMAGMKKDGGEALGVVPSLLVVGPSNYSKAKTLLQAQLRENGESNIYYSSMELLQTPWLA